MDKLVIGGGKPLSGTIQISGAKNAALPVMVASLLSAKPLVIDNIPGLRDIDTMAKLLKKLGVSISTDAARSRMTLDGANLSEPEAPYELVRTMRASFLVLGPLLARLGKARVSLPGGCAIGTRPIDLHLKGLAAMGADIKLAEGYVEATARRLKGAEVVLEFPSVGATQNLMMAATLAEGATVISNAAREPEIVDLAACLNSMGARVMGAGTDTVTVEGGRPLGGAEHGLLPDRLEAGSYLLISILTGSRIRLSGARRADLHSLESKLLEAGVKLKESGGMLEAERQGVLKATDIVTLPHPGFPTDMQAQWMALMCMAEGSSVIRETVFENRFQHVPELNRMGADIAVKGNTAVVRGVGGFKGAPVMVSDLRAGIALVQAGLVASGTTEINRVYHLDRGYERLVEKLRGVGADISRVPARA